MENKKLTQFFADTIRNRELTEEQQFTLQQLLFPGIGDDEAARLRDGALDMGKTYLEWEKKNQSQQETPMSDSEVDALAAMF